MVIQPHGGLLISRELTGQKRQEALRGAEKLPSITVNSWIISDMELLGTGGFSPLKGFMVQADYESVVENTRLADGTVWSIPITLPVTEAQAKSFHIGESIALKGKDGTIYGTITLEEKYAYDQEREAQRIYGTTDLAHPGVQK